MTKQELKQRFTICHTCTNKECVVRLLLDRQKCSCSAKRQIKNMKVQMKVSLEISDTTWADMKKITLEEIKSLTY